MEEKRMRLAVGFMLTFSLFLSCGLGLALGYITCQNKHITKLEKTRNDLCSLKEASEKKLRAPLIITIPKGTLYVFNKNGYEKEITDAILVIKLKNGVFRKFEHWNENNDFISFIVPPGLKQESLHLISSKGFAIYSAQKIREKISSEAQLNKNRFEEKRF